MNELLKCVLCLSLSGTSLILLLFLCKPLLKNVPNKRWQYYLWLIVIARLLIPFAPKISFVPIASPEADLTVVQATTGTGEKISFVVPVEKDGEEFEGFQPAPTPVEDNGHPRLRYQIWEVFTTMLWVVWLTGAAVLFARKITAYQRYVKGINKDACQVSDPRLLDLLSECGEQVGVMRPVELSVNRAVASPMLIGFFRPCVILSTVDLTESDLRYTFLHELTHERRRDILYKWLVQFTLCVHWFNPFVWLMSREIDRACELSCDEAVISKLESRERLEYGDMLMNAVRIGGSRRNLSGFMALYESKKMIRERLGAIMDFRRKTRWTTLGSLSLALCLLTVSAIAGAYLIPSFTGSVEAAGIGAATNVDPAGHNEEDALFNSQAEAEFLLEPTAEIQSGNESFAGADADRPIGTAGGWEVEDFIAEAVKHITVYNECSMLGEVDIFHISNTAVKNVLEAHAGVYSYDNVEVWLERDQIDEDGNIVVDVTVSAIRTLIRDPEKSPLVKGMRAAMEEYEDPEEKEAARQIIEARLEDIGQYYNVPDDYPTGYCYRVYISRLDISGTAAAEYEFYHRTDLCDESILTKMEENEIFTETFTEEDGREFVRDEVQRIMAARAILIKLIAVLEEKLSPIARA